MKLIIQNCGLLKECDNYILSYHKEIPLEFPTMPLLYNLQNTNNFLLKLLYNFIEFNYVDPFGESTIISKDLLKDEDEFTYSLKIPVEECPIFNNKDDCVDILYENYKDYITETNTCCYYSYYGSKSNCNNERDKLEMHFIIYKIQNEKGLEEVKVYLLITVQCKYYIESIMIKHNFSKEKINSFLNKRYIDRFKHVKPIMSESE